MQPVNCGTEQKTVGERHALRRATLCNWSCRIAPTITCTPRQLHENCMRTAIISLLAVLPASFYLFLPTRNATGFALLAWIMLGAITAYF